jgi:hypothetical protein
MCWRLSADIKPAELQMDKGLVIDPLAFLSGGDLVAAACLRKIKNDEYIAGVLIRSAEGLFRERIDVNEGEIFRDGPVRSRQTTAVLRMVTWWSASTATPRPPSPIPLVWGYCIGTAGYRLRCTSINYA